MRNLGIFVTYFLGVMFILVGITQVGTDVSELFNGGITAALDDNGIAGYVMFTIFSTVVGIANVAANVDGYE